MAHNYGISSKALCGFIRNKNWGLEDCDFTGIHLEPSVVISLIGTLVSDHAAHSYRLSLTKSSWQTLREKLLKKGLNYTIRPTGD